MWDIASESWFRDSKDVDYHEVHAGSVCRRPNERDNLTVDHWTFLMRKESPFDQQSQKTYLEHWRKGGTKTPWSGHV